MRKTSLFIFQLMLAPAMFTALAGCRSAQVQTIWKAESPLRHPYSQVLVVAVMPGENDSLRSAIERQAVQELASHGQQAVSYTDGFSIYGMAQATTQEAAYFTLCEKGIEAVLTIAKCDPALTTPLSKGTMVKYPSSFYFNHIWNYRSIDSIAGKKDHFIWEAILFDLDLLEQRSVLQVNNTGTGNEKNDPSRIVHNIIGKIVKQKMIIPQTAPARTKAF